MRERPSGKQGHPAFLRAWKRTFNRELLPTTARISLPRGSPVELNCVITSAPIAVSVPWKFVWGRMLAEKQAWEDSGTPGGTVTWKVVSTDPR